MIELIPAIDLIDGKCVRLTRGDYATQKIYAENPAEMAKRFEGFGFKRLHVVDLDGAKSQHIVNQKALEEIATQTALTIDFGGGIKTRTDLQAALDSGATYVTVGSLAATSPALFCEWVEAFGPKRFILGADVANGEIRTNGWLEGNGVQLFPFLEKYHACGIRRVLCTDIARDGTLAGPSIELYKSVLSVHPDFHLIASGGVSGLNDLRALQAAGIPAVVFGKAIYEGRIDLSELSKEFLC